VTDMLDLNELHALIDAHGLDEHADRIVSTARVGVLVEDLGKDEDESPSHLGGTPLLPPGFTWPEWRGRPLSFFAAIRLEDVRELDIESILPLEGRLLFFRDSADVVAAAGGEFLEDAVGWGFDPVDAGGSLVFHVAEADLARREPPAGLNGDAILPRRRVSFRRRLTVLPWESFFDDVQDPAVDRYFEFAEALDSAQGVQEDVPIHQLLGHPDQIQGDMRLECQLVTNGLYAGDASGYEDPRAQELARGASDWRLLFQLDSDEDRLGVMWGDVGRIYFWMRDQDLRARRFDAAWTILQCS
jgi:uncharacterized protein YwqG